MAFPGTTYPGLQYPGVYVEPQISDSSAGVHAVSSRVLVNGVERPVISWSVDRELSGDLPAQVVAVTGLTQATGSIQWATHNAVSPIGQNPWNPSKGWLPSKGDRVEIFVTDSTGEHQQFHGLIDKTTGSVGAGFSSTLIDDYDRLSASVSHGAMLRVMPPLAVDGTEPYRSVGLHPLYYVDYALRAAGFYCTPPREYDSALYAPMQGSVWPHFGQCASSSNPVNEVTEWGLAVSDVTVDYLPAKPNTMAVATQISLLVGQDHASTTEAVLDYGGGHHLRLSINAGRVAIAVKNGVEVCRISLGNSVVVSMLAKNGVVSLRTGSGDTASGGFVASGGTLSNVRLTAGTQSVVAGFQVSYPVLGSHEHASTRWAPNTVLDTTSLYLTGIIDAAPTIEGRTAGELLDEINRAVLSAMWIDERGVMRWVSSDALRIRAESRTVTTLDDVLSLDWEDGLLQTASKVIVRGRKPAVTKGRWRNLVLARGGGESLKSGDDLAVFLEPEADTDWISPVPHSIEVGGSGNIWGPYNDPSLSAVGLYYTTDGGTTTVEGLGCTITTEEIGLQKILVKYEAGTWPDDVEGVLATSPTNENLWPKNRNQNLPRLVGRGKIQWGDHEVSATGAGGPGPELVHEVGVWGNRTDSDDMLQRYAAYLQTQTASPKATINALGIVPDPRLKLGDVIAISSPDLMGAELKALVVGVSSSYGAEYSQDLSVRIISASASTTTYQQFGMALEDLTYQQWQVLGPDNQTYADFNRP